ncbi:MULTISPECIES: BolA family protein [unclassified Oceanobacter]|jgi:acid stress-induced BolA-like protein IbaG/YrbA|uniref:BolA family protein n=1 Tax=unclassified Oceanobacter TaxID=2620260 RepID=UPI0026E4284A|nr:MULTISPECIES: BolA/IbaG family iron-sulfur metabolism protein [unclassified Oceanobacter]MDO6681975.1 BolA/IbaG family iron-sulfur metabolism protein [Oceanobacter sp. 5_MG-2023]MDP2505337.1 BolA/IbaG family iron-sulfur metabolism protein [Oceanobacter sp. 3_MG-2023]MDP2548011.1 BolA/IbaG family iron-sulfur metabolism protein [Oceanobacter sp. 4_MG-2023]MDP2610135.1 BolA/IbaG family iron-sulfur metabolism protein [Oceanobacter sp. 1_MG-2023]MDP2612290.1 BolA/IbaG family iron-sulfur metaboli
MAPSAISEILTLLNTQLPDIQWHVDGDGYQYLVEGVGDHFEGLNAVKRQQVVYQVLNPLIAAGSLHAVTIRTFTSAEYAAR